MYVSYAHPRYELSGTMDTGDGSADFVYTRRPITREGETVLPPDAYRRRYLNKLAEHDGLFMPNFTVLEPTMTGSLHNSFNQPRIQISGSLYLESAESVMSRMSGAAMRLMGGPITPDRIRHELAMSALQKCGRIIMSEFEGFILPRD